MVQKIIVGMILLAIAIWAVNTSAFTKPPENTKTRILAHRGIHQSYNRNDLGLHDCTATRIGEPAHGFLENTIPSMRGAIEAGADIVEIDIHRTEDGHFAVFHDWDVGCRTEAEGKIETFTRAELKTLDIGHGYSADGGMTFPFRGRFVGAMPMLSEVFSNFPDGRFLVNLKSNNRAEGEAFAALVLENPDWANNIYGFYGGPRTVEGAAARLPQHIGFSTQSTKTCLKDYALWGWSGCVPDACRDTQLLVPINYAPFLWGWPHKFTARMRAAGSEVLLAGPYTRKRAGSGGINDADIAAKVPDDFDGVIWTDRAEHMANWLGK